MSSPSPTSPERSSHERSCDPIPVVEAEDEKTARDGLAPYQAFSRSLPMALLKAREDVMAGFRPNLRHHKVTEQQWRALKTIAQHGELRAGQLADLSLISMPSLTRILRDLAERGAIERRSEPTDQRTVLVSLTDLGRALVLSVGQGAEAHYQRLAESFGTVRLAQLHHLLEALSDCLTDE